MERYVLPEGWEWTTLGKLCTEAQYGYTTKASLVADGPKYLRISDLAREGVEWDTVPYCTEPPADMDKYLLHDGDLVIARAGSIGKAYRVVDPPFSIFASYLIRFRPLYALGAYLEYFLNSPAYWEQIRDSSTGTTMFNVNATKLAALQIPLPPLAEQRRIVARLDAVLAQARHSRAALDRLPTLLKQARQAILAAAFRGDLTERDPADEPADALLARIRAERRARWEADLRARGKDPAKHAYSEPAAPDTADLPELPEGWAWTSLTEVAWEAGYGTSEKCDYGARGRPVVRIPNIVAGRLDLTDLKHAETDRDVDQQSALAPGDLLVVRTNGSRDLIGRGALVTEELEQRYDYASYLIRFRLLPEVAGWIALAWSAPLMRRLIEDTAATSAGQYNVNLRNLSRLPIPLPPTAEQKRLVTQIQRTLAEADTIEAAARLARRRLDLAEQALLARAFRGELVPQDPTDEPASAMLARLREAREAESRGQERGNGGQRAKGKHRGHQKKQPPSANVAPVQGRLNLG